jgi:uncharacterized membrane protein
VSTNPDTGAQSVLGINPDNLDNIPQTPEDAEQAGREYLKQEWNKIILKLPVIGSIHGYFVAHPLIFQILFKEPYNFSLTFICIFILWVFILVNVSNIFSGLIRGGTYTGLLIGLAVSVALAQVGVIGGIVRFVLSIIYARDTWWIRLLLWLVVIVVLMLVAYFDSALKDTIKKSKEEKEKAEVKEKAEESEEFIRGVKEGQEISKPIRELKKKNLYGLR